MDEGLTKRFENLRAQIPLGEAQDAHRQAELEQGTITVLVEFPERARPVFEAYEKHKPEQGIKLAREALLAAYQRSGIDGMAARINALPRSFLQALAKENWPHKELDYFCKIYIPNRLQQLC
jgi:hypothetical protein